MPSLCSWKSSVDKRAVLCASRGHLVVLRIPENAKLATRMWFPLALLCVVLLEFAEIVGASAAAAGANSGLDEALEVTFSERTRADWEKVWHQESHSRCREKLIRHLYWACEKDIYRISRRNDAPQMDTVPVGTGKRSDPFAVRRKMEYQDEERALSEVEDDDRLLPATGEQVANEVEAPYPWAIDPREAHAFLRTRRTGKRRSGGSITAECCNRTGCTWEEYAEYCPSNKRLNHYRRRK
ncbi:probable insulin-like peptide 7 [Anopheles aquasalis]|uniref:probable insulin-like peptide 7 n=1 Tax=Anopheles aquasalis TaxID=42839 RepID=UPI00215B45F7|nr:probable insulin-like peptide 7 [Anopheles aquasalis]